MSWIRIIIIAQVALLLASSPDLAAQSAETESATAGEPAAESAEASEDGEQPEAEPRGEPGDEVFIPTEDISEDFAVSFPVDI